MEYVIIVLEGSGPWKHISSKSFLEGRNVLYCLADCFRFWLAGGRGGSTAGRCTWSWIKRGGGEAGEGEGVSSVLLVRVWGWACCVGGVDGGGGGGVVIVVSNCMCPCPCFAIIIVIFIIIISLYFLRVCSLSPLPYLRVADYLTKCIKIF